MKTAYLLLLSCLFFLSVNTSQAQIMEDVVYLKDGAILRGEIIRSDSSTLKHKIMLMGGSVVPFDMNNVYQIKREPIQKEWIKKARVIEKPIFSYREKGYYNLTQIGFMVGQVSNPWWWGSSTQNVVHFNFQNINGYRFHRLLAAGGGLGVSFFPRGAVAPIFLDLRSDLLQRPITPHIYANMGYGIPLYPHPEDDGWRTDISISGGYMYDLGFGVKINSPSGIAYTLTGGLKAQQIGEAYTDGNEVRYDERVTYQRISLQAGIMF